MESTVPGVDAGFEPNIGIPEQSFTAKHEGMGPQARRETF